MHDKTEGHGKQATLTGVLTALTNLSLAALYGLFAYSNLHNFFESPRASTLLIVIMETLVAVLFVIRERADKTSFSPYAWVTTIGGTFAPLFLRPAGVPEDLLIGEVLQVLGLFLAVYGVLSLNKSFGLLPAHRSVKSTGPYRWIRHPLYAAYTLMNVGYLINNFNRYNLSMVVLALAFQILRLLNEERFLSQYPEYVDYSTRTQWRLFPYIF